jgi:Na+-driven multidrug efflux pump
MQFVTNGLGTLYVSSQTTGSKIETFVTQPILSFGSAAAVFAAQNYGAKNYKRVIEGGRKTVFMCLIWNAIATAFMIPFGRLVVVLLAGDVSEQVITNAYCYLVVNTVLTPVLSLLVVYKSILQAVGRNTWSMVSGFTEIVARAGVSFLALGLLNVAVLNDSNVFFVMCFSNPMAWVFGFLTIIADYIFMCAKFKKLSRELSEKEEKVENDYGAVGSL